MSTCPLERGAAASTEQTHKAWRSASWITNKSLIRHLTDGAWRDLAGNGVAMDEADMRRLLRVEVPDYGVENATIAPMCYTEQTGMTRGTLRDLSGAFGKAE